MNLIKLQPYRCCFCPLCFHYEANIPQRRNGIMMKCGQAYCLGAKKARRLLVRELKLDANVSDACPKRLLHPVLKVYSIWDNSYYLQNLLGKGLPNESRYVLRYTGTIDIGPYVFQEESELQNWRDLLNVKIESEDVFEIDDGLQDAFFYYSDSDGGVYLIDFNKEAVKHTKSRKSNG